MSDIFVLISPSDPGCVASAGDNWDAVVRLVQSGDRYPRQALWSFVSAPQWGEWGMIVDLKHARGLISRGDRLLHSDIESEEALWKIVDHGNNVVTIVLQNNPTRQIRRTQLGQPLALAHDGPPKSGDWQMKKVSMGSDVSPAGLGESDTFYCFEAVTFGG